MLAFFGFTFLSLWQIGSFLSITTILFGTNKICTNCLTKTSGTVPRYLSTEDCELVTRPSRPQFFLIGLHSVIDWLMSLELVTYRLYIPHSIKSKMPRLILRCAITLYSTKEEKSPCWLKLSDTMDVKHISILQT